MIKSNICLVLSIAKKFQGTEMNLQDLVQEGCRGLVKGAENFDASKGCKFSIYAHWWIKQAVCKSLSDQSRTIRLPTDFEATLPTEALLTGEEATIITASAAAFVKTAVEVAKDAAQMKGSDTSVKLDRPENFPSKPDMILLERVRLAEMESLVKVNDYVTPETRLLERPTTPSPSEDEGVSSLLHNKLELQETQDSECIAVRSRLQTES